MKDYRHRDFGSLVPLGEFGTVGNMMIEGAFARVMDLSLHRMRELALHGFSKAARDTIARRITRRIVQSHAKLH